MYFELQLSAAVFSRVIRNRLRAIPLGLDLSLPDESDGELVVDQVVIGDSTTVQREKVVDYSSGSAQATPAATQSVWTLSPTHLGSFVVPYMQMRQEVRVLLVRASDLVKNGPKATPPALTVTVFPVFNVSLNATNQTQGGGPLTLTYALAYVDFGPIALALNDAQRAQIAQATGSLTIASSIVDLSSMTKLMNRPVTAINAGIACDPTGTRVALRVDFDINASPIAVDRNFFEVGPADLLGGKDWAMLMDANVIIQEAEQRIKAALAAKANLRIRSDPLGAWDAGEATLRVAADIRLLGACPGFVDDIDMDVRIDLGTRFKVQTPDHLITHYQLNSGLTNSGQVFGCALTATLLYPFAGAALLEQKKIDLKGYLGGIGFGPYFTFGQLVGVINAQKLEDDISESLGETCHKINDSEYECTTAVNLVIQLVPTLNSRFLLDWVSGVPEGLVLSGAVLNLGELFTGSIDDVGLRPLGWRVLGGCTGNGKNNFRIGNEANVVVPYTPPAKVVTARVLSDPQNGYALQINDNEITVTPSNPPVPYDCALRVITTRGVRTVTIPATQPLTAKESKTLQSSLLGARLSCYYWEKDFTPIEKILWRVDPAFHIFRKREVRHWQVLVMALQPGSTLTVSTPDGERVLVGRPSARGNLQFSLMFDRDGPEELTLELQRSEGADTTQHEVSVRQALYTLRASLPVQGDVRRIEVTGGLRCPRLEITTDRQALRWDVGNTLAPQLLEATALGVEAEREQRVLHNGHRMGGSPTSTLARAIEDLVERIGRPHALGSPRVLGIAEALYMRTDHGVAIYDIAAPDCPREVHTLSGPGWFENTVTSLNLMVRHDPERQVIDVYEVAARHTVAKTPAGCG